MSICLSMMASPCDHYPRCHWSPHHTGTSPYGDSTGPSPLPSLYWASSPPDPVTTRHIQTCSTWTSPYRDPWHVQICSIWSLGCRQAGGWHSIEMPYCRNMFCLYGLCHRNQTQGLPQINHCFRHECKHHSNRNCFRFNCKHDNV